MDFFFRKNVDKAYKEICSWLDGYRSRLTPENRFLCSYARMKVRFPEYDDEILHKVWDRLVAQRRVVLDPLDGEWIVGKG